MVRLLDEAGHVVVGVAHGEEMDQDEERCQGTRGVDILGAECRWLRYGGPNTDGGFMRVTIAFEVLAAVQGGAAPLWSRARCRSRREPHSSPD